MKTPGMILLVAALFTARGMQAQDKVRITLVPPEGGTVKTIPPLPSDGMVERGSTLTLQATPAKGRMLDCIFAAADGPWRYYNECCAPESLLTCDRDYEVGASFLPAKTFSKIRVTNNVVYAQPGKKTLKYDVFAPRGGETPSDSGDSAWRGMELQYRGHNARNGQGTGHDRQVCGGEH